MTKKTEQDIITEALNEYLLESSDDYLYHATFRAHKPSISKSGLSSNSKHKNWTDSQKGKVYLAKDPHVALSYAETAEGVPEHHYDSGIVVYKVHKKHLNPKSLHGDSNVRNSSSDTLEYHGDIPAAHLEIDSEHDT
jgi:hypothetical protein